MRGNVCKSFEVNSEYVKKLENKYRELQELQLTIGIDSCELQVKKGYFGSEKKKSVNAIIEVNLIPSGTNTIQAFIFHPHT